MCFCKNLFTAEFLESNSFHCCLLVVKNAPAIYNAFFGWLPLLTVYQNA